MAGAKEIVVRVSVDSEKYQTRVLRTVAGIEGVNSVSVDKDSKVTVIGEVDPVAVTAALRKYGLVKLISVGPANEPEKKGASLDDRKDFGDCKRKGTVLDDLKDFSVHKKKGATLNDLKDFISYASKTFKQSRDFKKFFNRFLVPLKSTQLITVAMLVAASLLHKWESIYKFKEQCFELLGNMIHIANLLLGIGSREIEMGDSLILKLSRRSMNCTVDGFWLCCSAMGAFSREEEDFYAAKKNMLKLQMQLTLLQNRLIETLI